MGTIKYKGFKIVEVPHPIPTNNKRIGYDVMDGDTVKKNFENVTAAKNFIDIMTHWGLWEPQNAKKEE